jgi:uncharacterized membrane protein
LETGHRSLHVWLSSAPKPAEAASGASGLEGTFGPFSPNNLPLLIVAAVLVILVIVAIFVVAGQLRRPSSSKGKAGDSAHLGTGNEIAAGRAVAAGRADDVRADHAGTRTAGALAAGAPRSGAGSTAAAGSLSQFRDALIQAQGSLAQGGTSGDGIVHCWLALERGAERAGFGGKPGLPSTESTAEILRGLHPNRSDVQTLLRLYNWASRGVTEDQRRISQKELASAKAVLAALRASIEAKLAASTKA